MLRASRSHEGVQEGMGPALPAMTRPGAHGLQEDLRGQINAKGRRNAPELQSGSNLKRWDELYH